MATILTKTHPLLSIPFSADTDFFDLTAHCQQMAYELAECDDPALRMALCGRIDAGFALLQPGLFDPIPPHQIDRLTVDTLPVSVPHFESDAHVLCNYCQTLAQLLICRTLSPQAEIQLGWLLSALADYFMAEVNAPRWIRTRDGVKFIDEVIAG